MSKQTVPAIADQSGEISFTALIAEGRVTLSEMGADISSDLSFQEYQALARMGQQAQVALPWIVGDILAFGAKRFPELWEQAVDFTDRSNETLRKWKTVSEAFPMERRRFRLKHTYYQTVAFLAPAKADELLAEAERDRSIRSDDLRRRVQALSERKSPRLSTQTPADDEPVVNNQNDDACVMDATRVGEATNAETREVERREILDAMHEKPESTSAEKLTFALAYIKKLRTDPSFRENLDAAAISAPDCEIEGQWLINVGREVKHRQNMEFDNPRPKKRSAVASGGDEDFDPERDMPENLRRRNA